MIALNTYAYDFESDGIYYNLNLNDRTATVTSGDNKYKEDIVIPSSVFYANQELPVVAIGTSAFSNCFSLVSIEIPNSVTSIGDDAFFNCSSLVSIEIPNSVTSIGDDAFGGCSSLVSIEIPNSVTSIGEYAFGRCSSLVSIEIPNSVTSIGDAVFEDCSRLVSIEIPNSVTSIGIEAFHGCSRLVSIEIPNSVISIGGSAFRECSRLVSIEIPNSVTSIEDAVFEDCSSLVSIEIPNSVTSIGYSAFDGCRSLVSIGIPNSVTSIGYDAFNGCSSLVSIAIPNSVTSIGYRAFDGCSSLKNLFFEDGETQLSLLTYRANYLYIYWVSFKDSPIEELYLGRNLDYETSKDYGYSPFYENTGFKTISLGKYVTDARSIYPQKQESLEVINCYNSEPPLMRSFTNAQYANIIVNIPKGSLKAYKEDDVWGNFWNLIETLPSPDILPDSVILNIKETELNIGETFQLEATVLPDETTDKTITWTSSNNEVASVSGNGLVSAMSVGEAVITATCGEVYAECVITVLKDAGIESLLANPESKISIYSVDGVLIKKDCTAEDLKEISKGIYIIKSGNKSYKIVL